MTKTASISSHFAKGLTWFIMSLIVSVGLDVLQKHLGSSLHAFQITFLRFFFGSLVLLPLLLRQWNYSGFHITPYWKVHFFRGGLLFVGMALWCYGLTIVQISTATTLVYSIPLFTLILSIPILKERVEKHRWIATGIGFIGVMIVLNPTSVSFNPAALSLIFSAFLFALLDVFNKKYVTKESMLYMLFYTAFFTMALSFVPAVINWRPITTAQLGWLLAIGCGANLLLYCLLKSLHYMEASALAPFRYLDFIVSTVFGFMFFGEIPTSQTCLGLLIIVPSTCFLVLRENRKEKKLSAEAAAAS